MADPVCKTCDDTHSMTLGDRAVMCTKCPTPCETCRDRQPGFGPGAYCSTTPCRCDCHRDDIRTRRALAEVDLPNPSRDSSTMPEPSPPDHRVIEGAGIRIHLERLHRLAFDYDFKTDNERSLCVALQDALVAIAIQRDTIRDALADIREHQREYHHVTPAELIERLTKLAGA